MKYETLVAEIAKRGITKTAIARRLNISPRCFKNKLEGASDFTWSEACTMQNTFFPDMSKDDLLSTTPKTA